MFIEKVKYIWGCVVYNPRIVESKRGLLNANNSFFPCSTSGLARCNKSVCGGGRPLIELANKEIVTAGQSGWGRCGRKGTSSTTRMFFQGVRDCRRRKRSLESRPWYCFCGRCYTNSHLTSGRPSGPSLKFL